MFPWVKTVLKKRVHLIRTMAPLQNLLHKCCNSWAPLCCYPDPPPAGSTRLTRENLSREKPKTKPAADINPCVSLAPEFQALARFAAGKGAALPCSPRHSCQATSIGAATAIEE